MSARNDESYLKFWSRRRFTPPCVGIHYSPRMLGCGEMPPVIDWLLCEPNLSKAERKGCVDCVEKLRNLTASKIPPKLMTNDLSRSVPSRIGCSGFQRIFRKT